MVREVWIEPRLGEAMETKKALLDGNIPFIRQIKLGDNI